MASSSWARALPPRADRRLAAAIVLLLVAQTLVLSSRWAADAGVAASAQAVVPAGQALPADVDPQVLAAADAASRHQLDVAAEADHARALAADPARARFEAMFPAQAAATEQAGDPASLRWAVVVGINEHLGRVRDNYGSRQDAMELTEHLLSVGWRRENIVLLTDTQATREAMVEALRWLGRKTTEDSVAVVHYSGHSKKWYGQDHDGDGEVTDEGLWPTDDGFIVDSEFVRLLDGVEGRLWVNISACESAGFNDPGLDRAGRLLTFSAREDQKSYEDPSVSNSVWGYYLVDRAMVAGLGDADGDGEVTVEEAFDYAAPAAEARTRGQSHGHQSAVRIDRVPGAFSLVVPEPAPEPEPSPSDDEGQDDGDDGWLCIFGWCPWADGRLTDGQR